MSSYVTTKGTIYLSISQFFFLVCGYTIHIFLARKLGPDNYGTYVLVMSILLWAEMSVLSGFPQAFAKLVSEDLDLTDAVCRIVRNIYLPFSIGVMMIFFLLSPLMSTSMGDRQLLLLLIIAGFDIPFFGMFVCYRNVLSGAKEYLNVSIVRIIYVVLRAISIIVFVFMGFSITGALIGNILGSFLALILAYYFVNSMRVKIRHDDTLYLVRRILTFGIPMLLYAITDYLVVNIDFWFVKGILKDDSITGYYGAAYTISRLPAYLMVGLIAAVFPSLSNTIYSGNIEKSRSIISQAIRIGLVILLPLCVVISTTSKELIELLYSSQYTPAAQVLPILIYGISIYALFGIFQVAIISDNRPFVSFLFTLIIVPIGIFLNMFLIPIYQIKGAAMATTFSMSIGAIVVGGYVYKRFRVIIKPLTIVRVVLGSIILYFVSKQMPMDHLFLILKYGILIMIYGVFMYLSGEVTKEEKSMIRAILPVR